MNRLTKIHRRRNIKHTIQKGSERDCNVSQIPQKPGKLQNITFICLRRQFCQIKRQRIPENMRRPTGYQNRAIIGSRRKGYIISIPSIWASFVCQLLPILQENEFGLCTTRDSFVFCKGSVVFS